MKTAHDVKKGVLTHSQFIEALNFNRKIYQDVGPVALESDGRFADKKDLKWKLGARGGKGLLQLCMTSMMPDGANAASSKNHNDFVPMKSSTWPDWVHTSK